MAVPKKRTKGELKEKSEPVAKDKSKEFPDLFDFKDNILISKTELIIDDKLYHVGDVIIETKFPTFNLLDNPGKYIYIVNRKRLIARIPKKIR